MTDTTTPPRAKLWSLIRDIRFGMFATHHGNGHIHARPMTLQNRDIDEDESLWYFMSRSGEPVADLARDPQVNVSFAEPEDQSYVSVSGTAELVDDPARKHALWNNANEAWFPGGPDDPDVALVRVRITHADYWDAPHNKLVRLYEMAKAMATGEPPQDMGDRARVQMR